tara:strand:+ start:110 stop:1267 length:1158 start_codon:yes stop_codon:yes gene_type:complete
MLKFLKIFGLTLFFIFFKNTLAFSTNQKIIVGLLVPLSGDNKNLGELIVKSTRMALKEINSNNIEIYPKDTASDPNKTLRSALELKKLGAKVIIGPVFFDNLIYLNEVDDVIFLSLTNKTSNLPKNIISSGVNSVSQLNAIKKFVESNEIKKTIFLTPDLDYKDEIKKAINKTKIKVYKHYVYNTEPTKLTKQIEDITNYKIRKQNLADEIKRIEKSDFEDKEKRIERLKKKYTIGNVSFDSVVISDFDESLKSVITSLLYTDVSPKKKYFITLNQWFDESLLSEKIIQPIYFPSINKRNLDDFNNKFNKTYNKIPNHLSLLAYDLLGLIYFLSLKKNDLTNINDLFKKKNSFKGKIGIFDVQNNQIYHRLNFYKIENNNFKKIF